MCQGPLRRKRTLSLRNFPEMCPRLHFLVPRASIFGNTPASIFGNTPASLSCLYILTHPSPQVAVQPTQRRRKEGAQRRGGQRHQDRVLARKGRLRTEKGAAMHGVCGTLCGTRGTLCGTQKLECTVEQRLGISGRVCGDTEFAGTQKLKCV